MFNAFRHGNIVAELQLLSKLLTNEINNLKELENAEIPMENKMKKMKEIRETIDNIQTQIDKLKLEIKLDREFKNN